MELQRIDPDDAVAVASYVEVTNEVRDLDSPWEHRMTQAEGTGLLRYGWDMEPAVGFLAVVDGEVVGLAEYSTSQWDNHHLAWLWVSVRPTARRRGHGSAIVELMADRARSEGRTTLGIGGWDNEAARSFAKRHGFELRSQEICRRQYLADLDRDELAARQREALPHADGVRAGTTPGPQPGRRARRAGGDDRGDQRRPDRRPRHRGRGVLGGPGARLRDRPARPGAAAAPGRRPAPGDRRAGRPHGGRRVRRAPRERRAARHRRGAGRTAATGSACCSRPTCSTGWPRPSRR